MAVRTGSFIIDETGGLNIVWAGLLNADTGLPVMVPAQYWKVTAQATGTFGAGGTALLEGSNNNVDWSTLKDVGGADISITTTVLARLEGLPKFLRPRVSAGDGTTAIVVSLRGVQ